MVVDYLQEAPPDWPTLTIERSVEAHAPSRDIVEDEWAEYRTSDGTGSVRMTRRPMLARFTTVPRISDWRWSIPGGVAQRHRQPLARPRRLPRRRVPD